MAVDGGCLCGAVRYRIAGPVLHSIICHCRSCRRASGAPSVAWLTVARKHFSLLAGTPAEFASSPGVSRGFCGACGTPLTYRNDGCPADLDVTTVSLDDPSWVPPTREVWLEHKLDWEASHPALDHYAQESSKGL
jgi:hypothetical protein